MRSFLLLIPLLFGLAKAQMILPANMYADTTYAPFLHGVASGDPTPTSVLIWTKISTTNPQSAPISLDWEVAADEFFANIEESGSLQVDSLTDWTVTVEVNGLAAGRHYWYRFREPGGQYTRIGRTQTAPTGAQSSARVAVVSCSSVYSGFFNAYRRIGEREGLDLVVHLGDYIYDFVDQDEPVRVPEPLPVDPENLEEYRDRHEYYLLDPDLRLARQIHPWVVIWDNHDVNAPTAQGQAEAKQAMQEYVPMRLRNPAKPDEIWRKLSWGSLFDLLMIDITTKRDIDTVPGGEMSVLGDDQWNWLSQELSNSTADWRLIGNEKMMANFSLAGLPGFIPFGDGPVADSNSWDGYNADRLRFLNYLDQNNIDNSIVLSGDIHMAFANDLAPGSYDQNTGNGSVAVEMVSASISRGNFDEAGFGGWIADLAETAMRLANPHFVYMNLEDHGYTILHITPDSTVAEYWFSDILAMSNTENFAGGYICRDGENHWERDALGDPITTEAYSAHVENTSPISTVYPNPAEEMFQVRLELKRKQDVSIKLYQAASGKLIADLLNESISPNSPHISQFSLRGLPAGVYVLEVRGETFHEAHRLVKASSGN